MTSSALQAETLFGSNSAELLRRGAFVLGGLGSHAGVQRFFACAKTFLGLSAAAVIWVSTAVFVACPEQMNSFEALAPSFFNSNGSAYITHASVLAILVGADIWIAIVILGDHTMREVILSRVGFGIAGLCFGLFLLAALIGVHLLKELFVTNKSLYLLGTLLILCIPRGLSYWKPQGKVRDVPHSVGS